MNLKRSLFSKPEGSKKEKKGIVSDMKDFLKSDEVKESGYGTVMIAPKVASLGVSLGAQKNLMSSSKLNKQEADEVNKRLLDVAKKQNTKVVNSNSSLGSYVSEDSIKSARRQIKKHQKKNGLSDSEIESLLKKKQPHDSHLIDEVFRPKHKDVITVGKTGTKASDPAVLAHELGHSQYRRKDGTGGAIGKIAHKANIHSLKKNTSTISLVNGIHSGIKEEKAKQEGKKVSTWNKAKTIAVPVALSAPLLISEAAASKKGLEMLKKSGASKELIKDSKKLLGVNYGTYLAHAGKNVASGEVGRRIGKSWVKYKNKKTDKKGD